MKISLNAYIYAVLVRLFAFSSSSSVDADEHTGTKWNIGAVSVSSVGNNLSFSYGNIDPSIPTSDILGTIYDGDCWTPTAIPYGKAGKESEASAFFTSLGMARSSTTTSSAENEEKTVAFTFTTDTTEIAKNPTMYEAGKTTNDLGKMTFCVRFSLYDAEDKERNYKESVISLKVKPNKVTKTSHDQMYKVKASLCDGKSPPFKEGESISVCIEPDMSTSGAGTVISSVDKFTWTRDGISQQAIKGANTVSNDGLTAITNTNGTGYRIESMLFASFYTSNGKASGTGSVTLQFPKEEDGDDTSMVTTMKSVFSVELDGIIKPTIQQVTMGSIDAEREQNINEEITSQDFLIVDLIVEE